MFIGDLSKWPLTSFVPPTLKDAVLWCDASPVCCSFHSFWPIPTILFAERSGIPEFSYRIERKLIQMTPCHWASTRANWLVCTCSFKELSFPRSYNPYRRSWLHRTGFGAKYASEKCICYQRFRMSLHIGLGAVPLKPNICTCKWLCGARLNEVLAGLHHLIATPGMPSRRGAPSMDRADGTSKARGNEALISGHISRRDSNHTHEWS
jgi:hypothetical protein